jgi:choline dehydrogenase-like flavoprotein
VQMMDWLLDGDDNAWPNILSGGWHHMGTARMHEDPKQGVVDANCKVHGLANLSVAGGAVYPTGGAVNPTLTVVAVALRLSDHLKTVLR